MSDLGGDSALVSLLAGTRGPASARALVLTFFGLFVATSDRPVSTRTVVTALATVGVDEPNVRRTLTRVAETAVLAPTRNGRETRWDLTSLGREMVEKRDRQIFAADGAPWDGRWLLLAVTVPDERRAVRYALRTRLAWAGFGLLKSGLWISPYADREPEAVAVLTELELTDSARTFLAGRGALTSDRGLVREAWELEELDAGYRQFLDLFGSVQAVTPEGAFAAELKMVTQWIGFVAADVGLPNQLLPESWSGRAARQLFLRLHREWHPAAQGWCDEIAAR